MAIHEIHIQRIKRDGSLKLSHETLKAKPGDTVKWIIDKDSGVAAITSILDISFDDVFCPDPKRDNKSKSWVGLINPYLSVPQDENYCIYYTKLGGTEVYADDPKIQVDSGN